MHVDSVRLTAVMQRSLQSRLTELDERIGVLAEQRAGDDSVDTTALLMQLTRERDDIAETLRDAMLIDDTPFDTNAIEVGDTVTIRDSDGVAERYVLIDGHVRTRASNDWVSVTSPLGAAIVGRGKGDSVTVESPNGSRAYIIVDFERLSEIPQGQITPPPPLIA